MAGIWTRDLWYALLLTVVTQALVLAVCQIDSGQAVFAPVYQVGFGFLLVSLFRLYRLKKGSQFSLWWFGLVVVVSGLLDVYVLWTMTQQEIGV